MAELRFGNLLDRYGGDLARWPARARAVAAVALAGSAQARTLLAETVALEDDLRAGAAAVATNVSSATVAARAAGHRQVPARSAYRLGSWTGSRHDLEAGLGWSLAAMLVLAVGIAIGSLHAVPLGADREGANHSRAENDEAPAQVVASVLGATGVGGVE